MKILIVGSSGLVGMALVKVLRNIGYEVVRLVRSRSGSDSVVWNPLTGEINTDEIKGVDAVINLAGESISNGRWTPSKKKKIWDSRVLGTQNLCRVLSSLDSPPKVLINASAIGYYGDTGDTKVVEDSVSGNTFLSAVCQEWENATNSIEEKGVRVVKLRIGIVLTPKGGALKKMLVPFKMCVGGKIGTGQQYMSWIALNDLVNIIRFCLEDERACGPINAVAPTAISNGEFTKILGKTLNRPTIFPLPAAVARFLLGEMADELLLRGTRVVPKKLEDLGFKFTYPDLSEALKELLKV